MEMLLAHRAGNAQHYAMLSERSAKEFARNKQWDFAHAYWELASVWCKKIPDHDAAKKAAINVAECWVSKAEDNLANGKLGVLFSSHWMGMGLQALREAGAVDSRKTEVHRRFRELQQKGMTEFKPLELPSAVLETAEAAFEKLATMGREQVHGQDFEAAVFRLAFLFPPCDPEKIKRSVEEETEGLVWAQLTPTATVTEDGLIADQLGPKPSSPGREREEWQLKSAYFHARRFDWPFAAQAIDGARKEIVEEHAVGFRELEFLVRMNPLIPSGHEGILGGGIHAGFHGDWLVAAHLLIPQIEAVVRFVFAKNGIVTSTLESEGNQQEQMLGRLLYHQEMERIFGPALAFNLRGLLTEKFGFNLRNDLAHALIPETGFHTPGVVYLWWLSLHLCCIGHRLAQKPTDEAATT